MTLNQNNSSNEPEFSVKTSIQAHFRHLDGKDSLCIWAGKPNTQQTNLQQAILQSSSIPPELASFLVALDNKISALLATSLQDSITASFPCNGYVTSISTKNAILEVSSSLKVGEHIELVMCLDINPLTFAALTAEIVGKENSPSLMQKDLTPYLINFVYVDSEDKEVLIKHIFHEERKRIRKDKNI